jgi:quercetin dioxygenase-like cupin family protein
MIRTSMVRTGMVRTLCSAFALATITVALAAQAPAPFKRTLLQQVDLSIPGKEVVQALAELQAGGAAGRHTHPGEEIGYVAAGPVVVEIDGQPAKTLQTGEVFFIPNGKIHNAINRGTGVVKIVATYVVDKGKPVATPVQ